jgi:hypothetical protein
MRAFRKRLKRLSSVSSAPFLFSLAAYVENRSRSSGPPLFIYTSCHARPNRNDFSAPLAELKQNAPSPTALSSAGGFHEMCQGRHRRMLDICCPCLYPGVLLWPICHPTYLKNRQAWPRPLWRMTPYGTA